MGSMRQRLDDWVVRELDGMLADERSAAFSGEATGVGRGLLRRLIERPADGVSWEQIEGYATYWTLRQMGYSREGLYSVVADAVVAPHVTDETFAAFGPAGSGGTGTSPRLVRVDDEEAEPSPRELTAAEGGAALWRQTRLGPDEAAVCVVAKLESERLWDALVRTHARGELGSPVHYLVQSARRHLLDRLPEKKAPERTAKEGAGGRAERSDAGDLPADPAANPYGAHQRVSLLLDGLRETQDYVRATHASRLPDEGRIPDDPYDQAIGRIVRMLDGGSRRRLEYRLAFLFRKLFPHHAWVPEEPQPVPDRLGCWALEGGRTVCAAESPAAFWLPRAAAVDPTLPDRIDAETDPALPDAIYTARAAWHFSQARRSYAGSEEAGLLAGALAPQPPPGRAHPDGAADTDASLRWRRAIQQVERAVSNQNAAAVAAIEGLIEEILA